MPFMRWSTGFELGIEKFDEHHKHLMGLINKVYDDLTTGANHGDLGAVLADLANYATYHFASEEHWMRLHGYPELHLHQKEHFTFSNKLVEIREAPTNGTANLSLDVLKFLMNWLTNHIRKSDGDYGRFARGLPNDADKSDVVPPPMAGKYPYSS